ncbi:DMT family transporter [Desertibaculum subflavum]|uniref:DMT family transporter n=1 Tax=Desertibaculum subflavum TaxID=2268458 RepID=UPI000E6682E7
MERPAPTPAHTLKGIAFMTAAATVFPVMNATVKYLTQFYPVVETIWARSLGHFLFVIALFAPSMGWRLFRTGFPKIQLTRSFLLLASTACFFFAISMISLADATSITFTAPFIIVALSGPMLGERVGFARWACVVAGFAGMLIVVRPGGDVAHWASFLVVGSATCYALYQIFTRKVAGVDAPETTVTYSALVATLLMTLLVPLHWRTPESLWHFALFVSTGLLGGLGHYCVARALYWGQASVVSNFNYVQLLGAAALGYLMFGHFPDAWTWIGAAVIVASGIAIAVLETRRVRSARNPGTAAPGR